MIMPAATPIGAHPLKPGDGDQYALASRRNAGTGFE